MNLRIKMKLIRIREKRFDRVCKSAFFDLKSILRKS